MDTINWKSYAFYAFNVKKQTKTYKFYGEGQRKIVLKSFIALPDQDQQEICESSPPHYLFVDDDIFILDLLKSYFENEAVVSLANDGYEALEKITDQHFDVIISDVEMPILNGIALFKSLYAKDTSIGKRFVFCSGTRSLELEKLCSKHQVRFLSKPVCLSTLQAELVELGNNTA